MTRLLAALLLLAACSPTPRSAQQGAPVAVDVPARIPAGRSREPLGNLSTAAAPSSPVADRSTPPATQLSDGGGIAGGLASYVRASLGSRYLALPAGPGVRVRICGPVACVTRISTDAGPSLSMQRHGRIADLSRMDFARICGCRPEAAGLVRVSVSGP